MRVAKRMTAGVLAITLLAGCEAWQGQSNTVKGGVYGTAAGAATGAAIGGGAGTAVVMSTRGEEVHLPKGSALTLKLSEPLTIRVRG